MKKKNKTVLFIVILSILSFLPFVLAETSNSSDGFFKTFPKQDYSTFGKSIIQTQAGYVVAGSILDDSGPSTWGWVVGLDKNGNKQWEKNFGKKARDSAFYKITRTNDHGMVLVGSVNSRTSWTLGASSGWVVKVASNGKVDWDKSIQLGKFTQINDVKFTRKGTIVIVGVFRNKGRDSVFVMDLDSKGNILEQQNIERNGNIWGGIIDVLQKGGIVIAGNSKDDKNMVTNGWIAKLDDHGKIVWEYQIGGDKYKTITAITELSNGSIIIGGESMDGQQKSVWLAEIGPNGNIKWEKNIDTPGLCGITGIWEDKNYQIILLGRTCEKDLNRIWAAIITPSGEMKAIKKYLAVKSGKVEEAIITEGNIFTSVGSSYEQKTNVSSAWVFKGKLKFNGIRDN